jgi:hypothetical protein
VRFGDGWMPMGGDPHALRPLIAQLHEMAAAAGKPAPEVALLTTLPLDDPLSAAARVQAFAAIGVTRVIHAWRYPDAAAFARAAETLAPLV